MSLEESGICHLNTKMILLILVADIVIHIILCYKENKQYKQKSYRKPMVACKMYDYTVRYKLLIFIWRK